MLEMIEYISIEMRNRKLKVQDMSLLSFYAVELSGL